MYFKLARNSSAQFKKQTNLFLTLLLTLIVILTPAANASAAIIYNAIPEPLPSNLVSLGYEATSTAEFGNIVSFDGTNRNLQSVTLTLSSWACQTGEWTAGCVTTPGSTFTHPLTINFYNANADGSVGALISSKTQIFTIPFRPTPDLTCPSSTQWKDLSGNCFNGLAYNVTFDIGGVVMPNEVIYGIAFNTRDYGANPIGVTGPYDSLNVGLNTTSSPSVGNDVTPGTLYWNTVPYFGGNNTFKADSDWDGYTVAARFDATSTVPTGATASYKEYPNGDSVVSGGFTDVKDFVFTLSADGNPTRYQLKYWNDIPGSSYKAATPWNPSNVSSYTTNPADLSKYKDMFTQGNGTHYFAFSACDAANNCSPYSSPFTITYDNTAPGVPVHVSPANNSVRTTAAQTLIDWQDVADISSPVKYVYQSSTSMAADASGAFTSPAYTSSPLSVSQIPTPGTPQGVYYWHVKAVDSAGNSSAWSSPWKVSIDNTAPASPSVTSMVNGSAVVIPNNGFTNSYGVTTSWTAVADAAYYEYSYWNNISGNQYKENNRYIATPLNGTSNYGVFNQGEGIHYVAVRAVDAAGNKSSWSDTYAVTYDNTAPVVTVTGPDQPVVGAPVIPTTIATDSSTPLTYSWAAVDPANQALLSDATVAEPAITPSVAGTYDFVLTVTDRAGNAASANLTFAWEQPPTAPAKPTDPTTPPAEDQTDSDVAGASTNTPSQSNNSPTTNTTTDSDTTGADPEDDDVAVLSATDETTSDDSDKKSVKLVASTGTNLESSNTFFGSVWSWALLGLAAFVLLWFLVSRRRNNDSE